MAEQLKNMFNAEFLGKLGASLESITSGTNRSDLVSLVTEDSWEEASLIDRMHRITDRVGQTLSGSYEEKTEILKNIAPQFNGFQAMIFPDFAQRFGIDHPDVSLPYLHYVTRYSSSEFAIRPFILRYPEKAMGCMIDWSKDPNEHVRRLSSEGCRPRLPWSIKLQPFIDNPAGILPILETLKKDNSLYVRKSVANNLNDISKDHEKLVIEIADKWSGKHKHTDWIVKHACRSLLKAGHPEILPVFGYSKPKDIAIDTFTIDKKTLKKGDITRFSGRIKNNGATPVKLRLEYIVAYPRPRHHYEKVFFIKETLLDPQKETELQGKIDVEEKSTRKIYPGTLRITLQINGIKSRTEELTLLD